MEVVNIISTKNEIDGIPYWIIPGAKDEDGAIMTVSFIYRDKTYEIELDQSERLASPITAMKLMKLDQFVVRKMRPFLKNHK